MNAVLISIGDELLIGQVINTNASWLGQELTMLGVGIEKVLTISDDKSTILSTLELAEQNGDIIIMTGGLGPTKDDITKIALGEYFGSKMTFNESAYRDVASLFKSRGLEVTDINRQQAELPDNAVALKNSQGTAPGMWFEKEVHGRKKVFISLPGVPYEMKSIFSQSVLPRLKEVFDTKSILHKTILTQGMGESFLSEKIADWESSLPNNIKLAYLPQPGIVRLRLSTTGENKEKLRSDLEKYSNQLRKIIPDMIFGYGNDRMEEVFGKLLRNKKQTVSTAESCTGGYLSYLIVSIPGSSDYYKGSVIAYDNEAKKEKLGVSGSDIEQYGAVSEQVVKAMADGVRKLFKTNYSMATSGIAGPTGGSKEKPIGTTWIAVASEREIIARKFLFGNDRERNIRKASLAALDMLRKMLI